MSYQNLLKYQNPCSNSFIEDEWVKYFTRKLWMINYIIIYLFILLELLSYYVILINKFM